MTKKTTDTPVVSPLLDSYGNPNLVAPGEIIESAWGNSVAGRVMARFPTKAAMDSTAPAAGTIAVTTDNNVIWIRETGAWRATALGNRPAFRLTGGAPGQNIPGSTLTTVVWKAEASDPSDVVIDLTNFVVPPGWGGRWTFEWSVTFAGPGAAGARQSFLGTGANRYGGQTIEVTTTAPAADQSASVSILLNPGAQVNIAMYHTHGGALACNATANNYFQGFYAGPY